MLFTNCYFYSRESAHTYGHKGDEVYENELSDVNKVNKKLF